MNVQSKLLFSCRNGNTIGHMFRSKFPMNEIERLTFFYTSNFVFFLQMNISIDSLTYFWLHEKIFYIRYGKLTGLKQKNKFINLIL